MVPSMPDDVAVHGVSFTHDLPTVHPRRTKRWEKVLRDSPGVWGQLQKVSDSANSRHYAKTYPEGFRFAIRVLTQGHKQLPHRFFHPVVGVPVGRRGSTRETRQFDD